MHVEFFQTEVYTIIFYRRDSPYDAVVMHPKHKGKKIQDLDDGRFVMHYRKKMRDWVYDFGF